jgi:MraZ protein
LLFKGEYEHTVDDKNRAFIPKKFRAGLGESFVICKGFFDNCLYIFSDEEFEKFSEKLEDLPYTDEDAMMVQRELYANAADVELDKQGRIVIPQKLRDYAKIEKEVSIVGVRTHIEIWNKQLWQEKTADPTRLRGAFRNLRAQGVKI